jgi:hypothetical protein
MHCLRVLSQYAAACTRESYGSSAARADVQGRQSADAEYVSVSVGCIYPQSYSQTFLSDNRAETMLAFLRLLDERYGGAESYLISHANLTREDLNVIRGNITEIAEAASS